VIGGFEISGRAKFAETVGGDFYDFVPLGDGMVNQSDSVANAAGLSWLVTVADVSGHDPGASLLMANTRAYLRAIAQESSDPAVIIERLNRFVTRDVAGRRFVTMFIARIDPHQSAVQWSSAGHSAVVIRRNGETEELRSATIPVGVDLARFKPALATCTMLPGDVMLISTDGLAEAKNAANEEFGFARIVQVVRDNLTQPAIKIIGALQEAAERHCGKFQPADDETIVLICRQDNR
jgi:serine phosphatase RsbU (regulator of sigma subunit)